MCDDDFKYVLSENFSKRVSYFLSELNLVWDKYLKNEISTILSREKQEEFINIYQIAITRYEKYCNLLANIIKEYADIDPNENKSCKDTFEYCSIAMILAGSILEATIQFFLLVYISDYKKDNKYHWKTEDGNEVDFNKIKNELYSKIEDLKNDKTITSKQGRSIKEAINSRLKIHEDWQEISTMMLDQLIDIIKNEEILIDKSKEDIIAEENIIKRPIELGSHLLDVANEGLESLMYRIIDGTEYLKSEEVIEYMRTIQSARNNIHIFTKNNNCSFKETNDNIKILILLINELGSRISYKTEMYDIEQY